MIIKLTGRTPVKDSSGWWGGGGGGGAQRCELLGKIKKARQEYNNVT